MKPKATAQKISTSSQNLAQIMRKILIVYFISAAIVLVICLNHRFGCHADTGIWLCAALPLLLLLGTSLAVLAMTAVTLICISTNLVFSDEEKSEFLVIARGKLGRLFPSK